MARRGAFRNWDDYFIPGTRTLRNLFVSDEEPFGVEDPEKLRVLELVNTEFRMNELATNPLPGNFDYAHMKAIHRHIFQDVYEWAGEERVAPTGQWMAKDGHAYYPAGPVLTEAAEKQYRLLAEKNLLKGLTREEFIIELAEAWGEINVIHSFREGNTRAQVVFFSELTRNAGYTLEPAVFLDDPLRDTFVAARFHSQDTGDNTKLAEVLSTIVRA